MKTLKTIVVLLILFGLPAGSWYFLKYGFNWRKEKLQTLEVKGHFLNDLDWTEEQKEELYALMFYKTSVVKRGSGISEDESELIDQFDQSHTFQWLGLGSSEDEFDKLSSKDVRKFYRGLETLMSDPVYGNAAYMLVDTALQIRQVYYEEASDCLEKMAEDLAIVIPRRKEKDISIRNR